MRCGLPGAYPLTVRPSATTVLTLFAGLFTWVSAAWRERERGQLVFRRSEGGLGGGNRGRRNTHLKDGLVGLALGDVSESLEDSRKDKHDNVGSRADEDEEALDDVSGIRGDLARQDEPASDGATDRALLAVGPPRTQNFREISRDFHNARGRSLPARNSKRTSHRQAANSECTEQNVIADTRGR